MTDRARVAAERIISWSEPNRRKQATEIIQEAMDAEPDGPCAERLAQRLALVKAENVKLRGICERVIGLARPVPDPIWFLPVVDDAYIVLGYRDR